MSKSSRVVTGIIAHLRRRLVQNIAALYVVQFSNFLLPLVTVPYLSRVLGPDGWGAYVLFQSVGFFAWGIIEYSFNVTATREVAMSKEDPQVRADWIANVFSARLILSLAVVIGSWIGFEVFPMAKANGGLFGWAIVWAITFGWNLQWYLQGLERMKLAATLDLVAKAVATAGIFSFVHNSHESWRAFALQAAANLLTLSVALSIAYSEVPFRPLSFASAMRAMRVGWSIFVARLVVTFSTTGNYVILGMLVSPAMLGFFGGADKIVGAAASLLCNPISQAVFPRLSHSLQYEPTRAENLIRKSYWWMLFLGMSSALVLAIGAPWIVRILLGPGYNSTVPALRVMAAIPLFLALTNVFGMQWMLAKKLDRQFNKIVISSAVLNVALALATIPRFGIIGMAWALFAAKLFEMAIVNVVLVKANMHPLLKMVR